MTHYWRRMLALVAYLSALALAVTAVLASDRVTARPMFGAVLALTAAGLAVEYLPLPPRRPIMLRKYRLRLYDGAYELLADQCHAITLDLDGSAWPIILSERLDVLVHHARAAGDYVTAPRLVVEDWETGERVMDWAGHRPCR